MHLKINIFCFFASYAAALGLELWHQFRPRPVLRLLGQLFGAAGLFAQTYLPRRPAAAAGLAVRLDAVPRLDPRRLLPLRLAPPSPAGLGRVRAAAGARPGRPRRSRRRSSTGDRAAAPTVFLHRRRAVVPGRPRRPAAAGRRRRLRRLPRQRHVPGPGPPAARRRRCRGQGLRLLSLERLEAMNRRAIILAFPLLTAGLLVGVVLLVQRPAAARLDRPARPRRRRPLAGLRPAALPPLRLPPARPAASPC